MYDRDILVKGGNMDKRDLFDFIGVIIVILGIIGLGAGLGTFASEILKSPNTIHTLVTTSEQSIVLQPRQTVMFVTPSGEVLEILNDSNVIETLIYGITSNEKFMTDFYQIYARRTADGTIYARKTQAENLQEGE